MMIGCCHCAEESVSQSQSQSIASDSGSAGSAGSSAFSDSVASGSTGPGPCLICSESDGNVPSTLTVEWCLLDRGATYSTTYWPGYSEFGNCFADYEGPFTVNFDDAACQTAEDAGTLDGIWSLTTSCCYASTEKSLLSYNCSDATGLTNARVYVWFIVYGNGYKSVAAAVRWVNTLDPANDPQTFPDWIPTGGVLFYETAALSPLDCFGEHELSFQKASAIGGGTLTTLPGPGGNVYYDDDNGTTLNTYPPKMWVSLSGGALPGDACDYDPIETP